MCFAAPAQVVALGPGVALIERGTERLPIGLHLLDEPVAVGDWLAVQAQRVAVARLSAEQAAELLDLYHRIQQQLEEGGARVMT